MEIQIKQTENALLKRKELTGTISFSGSTPSNTDVQSELAKKLSVGNELVVVKHIYTSFGDTKARFEAVAYATKEQRVKLEGKLPEPKKEEAPAEKPAAPAEEKPAEAPAEVKEESKAEETPAEEKKEEVKAEEKPAEAPAEEAKE